MPKQRRRHRVATPTASASRRPSQRTTRARLAQGRRAQEGHRSRSTMAPGTGRRNRPKRPSDAVDAAQHGEDGDPGRPRRGRGGRSRSSGRSSRRGRSRSRRSGDRGGCRRRCHVRWRSRCLVVHVDWCLPRVFHGSVGSRRPRDASAAPAAPPARSGGSRGIRRADGQAADLVALTIIVLAKTSCQPCLVGLFQVV